MPDWRVLYEAAVDEVDPSAFERLLFETEDAICHRLRELSKNPDGPLELNEISDAVDNMLRLKTARLGWPSPMAAPLPAARYAHTFLFGCPACTLPISISLIRSEETLKTAESLSVEFKCGYCHEVSVLLAATAKAHWVTEWARPIVLLSH